MARKGRVINYVGNSQARDINGNQTQNWRIDIYLHNSSFFLRADFCSLLPNACCLVPIFT